MVLLACGGCAENFENVDHCIGNGLAGTAIRAGHGAALIPCLPGYALEVEFPACEFGDMSHELPGCPPVAFAEWVSVVNPCKHFGHPETEGCLVECCPRCISDDLLCLVHRLDDFRSGSCKVSEVLANGDGADFACPRVDLFEQLLVNELKVGHVERARDVSRAGLDFLSSDTAALTFSLFEFVRVRDVEIVA